MEAKKLYRSKNKMVAGVCAGIAEYLGVDPTLVRIITAFAILCGGAGLLAYIVCWFIIPQAN